MKWRIYGVRAVIFFSILCGFVNVLAGKNTKTDLAAKAAFEKLESLPVPTADAAYQCTVTQVGVILTGRSQRAAALPRDAYCRFLLALLSHDAAGLKLSPGLLMKAEGDRHNNMAPLLEVLRLIALLKNGSSDTVSLKDAVSRTDCTGAEFAGERTCRGILAAAQAWLDRSGPPPGQAAIDRGEWRVAVVQLIPLLRESAAPASLAELLSPRLDLAPIYSLLGYAQFMEGDLRAAVDTLNAGIARMEMKGTAPDPRSLFVRARIRSMLGLNAASQADLEMAAHNDAMSQGVLALRVGKAADAAAAFARAPGTAPDLNAWKLLARGCSSPLDQLAAAARAASPLFPGQETLAMIVDCHLKSATSLEQLLAVDAELKVLAPDRGSRERISNAYLRYGLDAEDHQNNTTAEKAYLRSLEWLSLNTKARFNLAAIYLGDRKFEQAERQYRSLLEADSADRESQFWLAQALLAASPTAARKSEACELLQQAQQIDDAVRRTQFAQTAASICAK